MTTITKLLIANRGEIARRIARTCRSLGIEVVAVYSDADRDAPFVSEADEAVRIGPAPSSESYLRIDAIVDAAKRTGAQAIHPGYGFLAENAAFARAVTEAGLVFVGPSAECIDAMGSKKEAKARVQAAGVPVVPGYDGASQDPATLAEEAARIGFPVLLKASAGGGGKGMKRVDRAEDVPAAIESAKREAKNAFGDDTLLIEKYIDRPRHIEVQILGDSTGRVAHLFERECSIQRRHQKVLEEAPSPALDEAVRSEICEAALEVARAIGYVNAGTVEFIAGQPDAAGKLPFYFLEVNTRLQVEHPVTEEITGVDLVREQIRIAEGHPLSFDTPVRRGAAVEARLYAEDPDDGYLPQSGDLIRWVLSPSEGVRVDAGVESGSHVGIHYDPMLAKIIAFGADREEARRRLCSALRRLCAFGVRTNRAHLLRVLEHPSYIAGDLHTHFLTEHASTLVPAPPDLERALIAATLAGHERRAEIARGGPLPAVPSGFRNNAWARQEVRYAVGDEELVVRYAHQHRTPGHFRIEVDGTDHDAEVRSFDGDEIRFVVDGLTQRASVVVVGRTHHVLVGGEHSVLVEAPRYPSLEVETPAGACVAPMPGKVVTVDVEVGAEVTEGQRLVVMEAMKMEHTVLAPTAGTVQAVHVSVGDQVDAAQVLVVVE